MTANPGLLVADHGDCHFEIGEDKAAGFYIFRFEGDDNRPTHDYLQDTLTMAKEFALEKWGVPEAAWRRPQEDEDIRPL